MQRWTSLDAVPAGYGPSVVTLGNFDGVHRGHRAVLQLVVHRARERDARAVAVTFHPHPVAVLHPERAPAQVTGLTHRLELMAATGLDGVLVVEFTWEFAQLSPEDFVRTVFVETLGATCVAVGSDTRFGLHNSGDITTMRELGERYGFEVLTVDPVGQVDAGSKPPVRHWSSTRVRQLLAAGAVAEAADVLGRPHRVSGEVVRGRQRGRALGYPTANLSEPLDGLVPADGVYAGWLERPGLAPQDPDRRLPAAISVGTNPTFDDVPARTVEAYVLDRLDLDLYGETVAVDFVARLRGNQRFDSVAELRDQMAQDVSVSRALLHH